MTVNGTRGTHAMLAQARPEPRPVFTTAQQLDRIRERRVVRLAGEFSLVDAVGQVTQPLGQRIAAISAPERFWTSRELNTHAHLIRNSQADLDGVDAVVDAVHHLVCVAAPMVSGRLVCRATAHLSGDARERAVRAATSLAENPQLPGIGAGDLADGAWTSKLIDLTTPYSKPLAEMLGGAVDSAVSDRLIEPLRAVDRAVRAVTARVARAEIVRPTAAPEPPTVDPSATPERARAELADLGVSL